MPLDIDAYIDGGKEVPQRAAKQAEQLLGQGSVILFPQVEKYSYKPGTSKAIMECFAQAAAAFDHDAACSGSSVLSICSSVAHWNPAWHRA